MSVEIMSLVRTAFIRKRDRRDTDSVAVALRVVER